MYLMTPKKFTKIMNPTIILVLVHTSVISPESLFGENQVKYDFEFILLDGKKKILY